ncbi:helix-turn-helix domain-containing protein [Succinimonas amylolytica]|uniref:helix-turn-helix domain-containing protein n=1 Tax=Succinimonas amylolytica TaxID=83769 RepID=UPI00037927C0|nr:excisionase family DNA-binding protein [Succinimonas amylolytica]
MEERKLEEKELLTVEEAITLFNLSRGKFKRLIREVELSFVLPYGKQRFIVREELIRYLSNGEQENLINAKFKTKKRLEA